MKTIEQILSASIQERAIQNVQKGMSETDAVKKAFEQEEEMIYSLLGPCGGLSKIGKEVAEKMGKIVYDKINKL